MICFGKTPSRATTPEATTVAEQSSGSRSSERSLGETVEHLPQHDFVDPQRMVEKMTSGVAKPNHVSNKCILV